MRLTLPVVQIETKDIIAIIVLLMLGFLLYVDKIPLAVFIAILEAILFT